MNYYDIIAITETCLKPIDSDSTVRLDGFNFYRLDRVDVGCEGIGVYIGETFKVKTLSHSDPTYDNTPEYLILEVSTSTSKILFAVVYRPPDAAYPSEFFDIFSFFYLDIRILS